MNSEPLDQFLWDATQALKVSILKVYPSYTETQQGSSIVSAHTVNEKTQVPFKISRENTAIALKYANKLLWGSYSTIFYPLMTKRAKAFSKWKMAMILSV